MPKLLTSDPNANRNKVHNGKVGKRKKPHPEWMQVTDYRPRYICDDQFEQNDDFQILTDVLSFQRNPTSCSS
jgi:hypothetical protein